MPYHIPLYILQQLSAQVFRRFSLIILSNSRHVLLVIPAYITLFCLLMCVSECNWSHTLLSIVSCVTRTQHAPPYLSPPAISSSCCTSVSISQHESLCFAPYFQLQIPLQISELVVWHFPLHLSLYAISHPPPSCASGFPISIRHF